MLTLAGLFQIFFSIPLAMFAWMVCGQSRIATFELLGLFLILCIGADDIFVWIDTWKERALTTSLSPLALHSPLYLVCLVSFGLLNTWQESAFTPPTISGSLETRFSWTYNRAGGALRCDAHDEP